MDVDKSTTPFILPDDLDGADLTDDQLDDIEDWDEDVEIVEGEDGSVEIDFSGAIDPDSVVDHDTNLADLIDDKELRSMAAELVEAFDADKRSRADWATAYTKGLDLLGFMVEERSEPWQGASGVFHPLLTEAVVRFQAQAMGELFPASGPCKTKIMGKITPDKTEQARRIQTELNYQMTEEMSEYRDELDQMLFRLPLAGSSFKKVYYDPLTGRPVSMFVPVEDFVVSYGASDLQTCPRYTHVMKKDANDILKLQLNGFYRDVDLPTPEPDLSDIQEKYNELSGDEATLIDDDDRHTLLEMHVDINMPEAFDDMDGVARPHVITIDKTSRTILSIRRNWQEDDDRKRKDMHFVHYKYLPGLGFYGTGLIHMIGGLAKSATSLIRQLIDAGTLSNLPGGLKTRGMRILGDDTPIRPGEFRDVDIPGGVLRDSISFLPYKEPSTVLYQLLGNVVAEGRRIGSVADIQVGNMNPEAPVGTTLALMEQSMKVMSGVQARLHAAMHKELRLIARVIRDYMPEQYDYYDLAEEPDLNRREDFSGKVDVIPVSDPNAATMAQRVVQYQSALQLAQQAPQLYNMGKLHRQMLEVMGIQDPDEIIKLPEDIKPSDPVTENMAMLKQEPVKVFAYQDHEAHIQVHMAAAQDPKIQQMVGQSPFASAIKAAVTAHLTEHIAMQYRVEIQKQLGVELPEIDAEMPEDVERQVSRLAAAAADKLLNKNQAEAQKQAAEAAEKDPLNQIQRAELEIKTREVALKEMKAKHEAELENKRFNLESMSKAESLKQQAARLQSDTKRDAANIIARVVAQEDTLKSKERIEGAKLGVSIASGMTKGDTNGRAGSSTKKD